MEFSNNALFINVSLVVHDARHPHLDRARHWLPHWLLLASVVELDFVLVHVLNVGCLLAASDEFLDAALGLVGVSPWPEHRLLPPGLLFFGEVTVKTVLAEH